MHNTGLVRATEMAKALPKIIRKQRSGLGRRSRGIRVQKAVLVRATTKLV